MKKHTCKYILFATACILFFSIRISAVPVRLNFSTAEGLSDASPISLLQDSKGRVWIGTWNGLNVYDGNSFDILFPGRGDFPGISSSTINKLVETDPGVIWAATSYGINKIEYDKGSLSVYMLGYEGKSTPDYASFSITADDSGNVFASSYGWGMVWYDPQSDMMVPVQFPGFNPTEIKHLDCAAGNRLYTVSKNGSVQKITYVFSDEGECLMTDCASIFTDRRIMSSYQIGDDVCFVTDDGDLLFDSKDGTGEYHSINMPDCSDVTDVCLRDSTSIFVSFMSSETFIVDIFDGSYEEIADLSGRKVMTICQGTEDILWAGIKGGGVDAIYDDQSYFGGIRNTDIFGDKVGAVSCFLEKSDGTFVFGTEGNGICMRMPDGRTGYMNTSCGLADNTVYTMSFLDEGKDILVGRYGAGIDVIRNGRIRTLHSPSDDYLGDVYSICRDGDSDVWWFGTFNYGLVRAVIRQGNDGNYFIEECKSWTSEKNPDIIKGNFISSVLMSRSGKVIAGTTTAGLFVFDPQEETAVHYFAGQNGCGLSNDGVFSMSYGKDSTIWVGTANGLNKAVYGHGDTLIFRTWKEKDGLVDPTIHGILEDSLGRVWVSTNDGISCVDPTNSEVMNFPNDPSLQSDEFTNGSAYIGKSGTFYFGGVSGYNGFDPFAINLREFTPSIHFNSFSVRQQPIVGFRSMDIIELSHDENYFSISFSALDFIDNMNCEYRYMLKGFDKNWVEGGENHRVSYTNVPPGKYEFIVMSTNGDKIWTDNSESLHIRIRRPWWNTIYAYFLYLANVILILYFIRKFRRDKEESRRRLEAESLEKQQQKDIYEAKLMFFTNIAHEFSSPLTLISSATELMSEDSVNSFKSKKYLSVIANSANRMQRLIQELIEFRKVDTGNYLPRYSMFDVSAMLRTIIDDFSELVKHNNISLHHELPDELNVLSDRGAIEKIMSNLISNAYKYTPSRGEITIRLSGGNSSFSLMVRNSGKGLDKDKLERIFDRFTVLDNFEHQAVKGKGVRNGIGMALVKSLLSMLKGEIKVTGEKGSYVQFDVMVPIADKTSVEDMVSQTLLKPDVGLDIVESISCVPDNRLKHINAPTLMIVDDDPEIRNIVSDIFDGEYNVIQACDGQDAINIMMRERPDLMIVDINMPVMNGIELVKYLRNNEITKMIPVAFLTFTSDLDIEAEANELGCEAFIPKPFSPKLLASTVHRIISNRNRFKDYYTSSVSNQEIYENNVVSNDDKKFMIKLTRYIEDNLQFSRLSQEELANVMNVSKSEFYRRVKRITKQPPVEFVRNIKLEKAAHLLKTTDMTAQEIMYQVGFSNNAYFYREFSKRYNISPIEYRKKG